MVIPFSVTQTKQKLLYFLSFLWGGGGEMVRDVMTRTQRVHPPQISRNLITTEVFCKICEHSSPSRYVPLLSCLRAQRREPTCVESRNVCSSLFLSTVYSVGTNRARQRLALSIGPNIPSSQTYRPVSCSLLRYLANLCISSFIRSYLFH
jgi:hypothetical protein